MIMPRSTLLKIIAWGGLAFLAAAGAVLAAAFLLSPAAAALFAVLVAAVALLGLDALWPRVNLFGSAVVRLDGEGAEKAVALTFDDGPVSPWTEQILEVLAKYRVKATFFCIGENVQRHPELARAIVEGGHTIGGHTATHRSLLFAGPAAVRREIEGGQEVISKATGRRPVWFRCPKGFKNLFVAREMKRIGIRLVGYSYPIWDVENPPGEVLVKRVLGRVQAGDVIVMHDGFSPRKPGARDGLVEALPAIIEGVRTKGLQFLSLEEALGAG